MSKSVLAIVVVGVMVIGGGVYLFMRSPSSNDGITAGKRAGNEDARTVSNADGGQRSLAQIAAAGGNSACTFSSEDSNATNSGTVYVANGKVRGDFTSTVKATGMMIASHMIQADGLMYVWSDDTPQGMKMMVPMGQGAGATGQVSGQYFDASAAYDYDCDGWSPDGSRFAPPSGVEFMELGF